MGGNNAARLVQASITPCSTGSTLRSDKKVAKNKQHPVSVTLVLMFVAKLLDCSSNHGQQARQTLALLPSFIDSLSLMYLNMMHFRSDCVHQGWELLNVIVYFQLKIIA